MRDGCYQFFAISNECKICKVCEVTGARVRSRVPGAVSRPSDVIPTQWHRLCKNGYACRSPTDQQWLEKTNNRIEIENSISFECDRTGFWKSGFDFVWFGFPRASSAAIVGR